MGKEDSKELVTLQDMKMWLRRYLVRQRQLVKKQDQIKWSRQIQNKILRMPEFKKAKYIATFLGFASEVITDEFVEKAWQKGKKVLIPITDLGLHKSYFALFQKGDRLKKSPLGPMELLKSKKPFNFKKIDLVLVPGLGFDKRGYRLGYGGGVYDRILVKTPQAKHIGLFFSFQQVKQLPLERHDRPLHAIVTEKNRIYVP
jgi:5-formyltetrahydrofolate cyclo-ligase